MGDLQVGYAIKKPAVKPSDSGGSPKEGSREITGVGYLRMLVPDQERKQEVRCCIT